MLSRKLLCVLSLAILCAGSLRAADEPVVYTATKSMTLMPTITGIPPAHLPKAEDLMIYGPKHANPDFRAVIFFDLKDLPKQPVVGAAVLKLTIFKCYGPRKNNVDFIRMHRVVRPWEPEGASWNRSLRNDEWINAGGDFDPMPVAASTIEEAMSGEDAKPVEFDVTDIVRAWQSGQVPNYGVELINADNDSAMTFRIFSTACPNEANRPKLQLYYTTQPKKETYWRKAASVKPFGNAVQFNMKFNTTSLNRAFVGLDYKAEIQAKGGQAPYTFKVTNGLPDGMALAPDGALTGKATKAGEYNLQVSFTDAGKRSGSGAVRLVVDNQAPKEGAAGNPLAKTDAPATPSKTDAPAKTDDKKPPKKDDANE